ncbi:MAG TPA: hypothetical protein VMF56_09255, partial [Acidobacteriaceae bacterium]|nr:hypothetical protein [Acidobacteriaceae bacterium]
YQGFSGLPPLVGLQPLAEATTKGLTVAESVARLLRLHWSLKRLHRIFVSRIAATPIYELKMAFSLHSYYCAEHVEEFATRIREMRQPPYRLETSPDVNLDKFFDEIQASPTPASLVLGLYAYAIPAVVRGLERTMTKTNRLFDHPTFRICRLTLLELHDVLQYGELAVKALVNDETRSSLRGWSTLLEQLLSAAGDLDGGEPKTTNTLSSIYSASPYKYDAVPQRDERFIDLYNMGVNAEALLFDPSMSPLPKSVMLYFKRMREIDVPEMMSSILMETTEKPWQYYRDMTRQLWDEARHAMMGEVGFVSMGIDWTKIPLNFTWSLMLNTQLTPLQRHAVLYAIEQGLMPKKNGKEYEWEVALATSDHLTTLIQDYDWADEILHARIGRNWLVPELGGQMRALAEGEACWTRIFVSYDSWRDRGLTQHYNWWPAIYREACKYWGIQPDPEVLAFDTSYESKRPDLKDVSG